MRTYHDLRDFIHFLEYKKKLKRINYEINTYLEITEIADRTLRAKGPALLFTKPKGFSIPILCNLFGTVERIIMGMGQKNIQNLHEIGKLLAFLKDPEPPTGFMDLIHKIPKFKQIFHMPIKKIKSAICQTEIWQGDDVDLFRLPIMHCWPGDIAPLITFGLTITKGLNKLRQNVGIYRQQLLAKNKLIMRWFPHRGGALDFKEWCKQYPTKFFPLAVVLGADPAITLAAVIPIPNTISEYVFAGLLRGNRSTVVKCISNDLEVPANAEIILEGYINPKEYATEGPYGDHTGYYNESNMFPVFTVTYITQRSNAIYHSTYTGRPPDEPSILGSALNEILIPILQKQFPEIIDFYLPPEACSYRLAVITIKKQYAGHAKRIMMGIWSYLYQFLYTKFIIICDDDINARNWNDVIWAITTRIDPMRDLLIIDNTPIDSIDFSSPNAELGSRIGLDATNKWPNETNRVWGIPIVMTDVIKKKIDKIWKILNIL